MKLLVIIFLLTLPFLALADEKKPVTYGVTVELKFNAVSKEESIRIVQEILERYENTCVTEINIFKGVLVESNITEDSFIYGTPGDIMLN